MKLSRCPMCKSYITLEQMVQYDAGMELLAIVAEWANSAVHYE